jgi:hypothetical protein
MVGIKNKPALRYWDEGLYLKLSTNLIQFSLLSSQYKASCVEQMNFLRGFFLTQMLIKVQKYKGQKKTVGPSMALQFE